MLLPIGRLADARLEGDILGNAVSCVVEIAWPLLQWQYRVITKMMAYIGPLKASTVLRKLVHTADQRSRDAKIPPVRPLDIMLAAARPASL